MNKEYGRRFKTALIASALVALSPVATAWLPAGTVTPPPAKTQGGLPAAAPATFAGPLQTGAQFNRLIIKFKEPATTRAGVFDARAVVNQVDALGARARKLNPDMAALRHLKSVTDQTHVALTEQPMSRAELFALAKRLEQDPAVAYAEIDELAYPQLTTPNDPLYASAQWHYQAPATHPGGANLPLAWDSSTGSDVVVAVIDTGYLPHADLAANILSGYDFIVNIPLYPIDSNDGDDRDPDASDPGDWVVANQCAPGSLASNSSWHGTHVAGTIAALTNNNLGVAGVAYDARILPVRALGKCGGYASDIAAGMRWAAGLSVPGVPANPNPAKVLNLSLGGTGTCLATYQDAVNAVRAAGSAVIAATGNDGTLTLNQPANCSGVIAVTAHTKSGDNAEYANIGPGTTLSAPGGGQGVIHISQTAPIYIASTLNTGTTTPVADSYAGYQGTSMATPHVAGVAALLASLRPSLTPDGMRCVLTDSVRPHPAGTFCANLSTCGTGLLDAKAAIDRLNTLAPCVSATAAPTGVVAAGSLVTLTAAGTSVASASTSFSYQWTQLSGPAVTLSGSTSASATFTAPSPGGTHLFEVTATDATGQSSTEQVSVTSNTPPVLAPIPPMAVALNAPLTFTATATDAEGNPVVYVASALPAGSTFDAATGVFDWPVATPTGRYSFSITPNDGVFNGVPQTVSITVGTPPSGGGGGATGPWELGGLLALLGLGAVLRRRHATAR